MEEEKENGRKNEWCIDIEMKYYVIAFILKENVKIIWQVDLLLFITFIFLPIFFGFFEGMHLKNGTNEKFKCKFKI